MTCFCCLIYLTQQNAHPYFEICKSWDVGELIFIVFKKNHYSEGIFLLTVHMITAQRSFLALYTPNSPSFPSGVVCSSSFHCQAHPKLSPNSRPSASLPALHVWTTYPQLLHCSTYSQCKINNQVTVFTVPDAYIADTSNTVVWNVFRMRPRQLCLPVRFG